jgi:membrane-associated protein
MVNTYGNMTYVILFCIIFAETGFVVTPFLPGDSLLFAAGAVCATTSLNVWTLIILLILAASLGNISNYFIGRTIGPVIFEKETKWIRKDYLNRAHEFYERYGAMAVILSRFFPIIRTFAPFIAGVAMMGRRKFILYTSIGALLWVTPLTLLGFWFGNVPFVKKHFSAVIFGIIIISLIPALLPVLMSKWRSVTGKNNG